MRTALLLALVATSALAEPAGTPRSRSVSLSTTDANAVHTTTGALTLYVDPTGNDGNSCIATGTGACLTIQGALNKVPKSLRHGVTVSVAAGTYGCFYVSGFSCDTGTQISSGGLLIDGLSAFTNSTLATGSATGTFTASSAGSGTTFGTGTDGAATWTVNDLVGRFVTAAGQTRVISSNTATAITIVGTWTNPGTVAYTIQDPGVVINTACAAPATPLVAAGSGASIWVTDNVCASRSGMIVLRGIRTTNAVANRAAIGFNSSAGLMVTLSQLRNVGDSELTVGSGNGTASGPGGFGGLGPAQATDVDMLQDDTTSNAAVNINSGIFTATRVLIRGCHTGVQTFGGAARAIIANLDVQACKGPSLAALSGDISSVSGSHFACDLSSRTGLVAGFALIGQNSKPAYLAVGEATMSTCGVGLQVIARGATADVTTLSGSVATTGFSVVTGGSITFSKSGVTMTAGTNELDLDSAAVTASFADVATGNCLTVGSSTSGVCAR